MGVQMVILRRVNGPADQMNLEGYYWSTNSERESIYGRIILCRSSIISKLDIRSVLSSMDSGYIVDGAIGS